MATEMLNTCPSGECMDYTYPEGWPTQCGNKMPRPVKVIIHTRWDYKSCQHLAALMDEPMPTEKWYHDGPGDEPGWQDTTFPNER